MTLRGGGGAGTILRSPTARANLLILLTGLAVMTPEAIVGVSTSDSMAYNIGWTEQFLALARGGSPYPRWLPDSWDGLGSPTFYFYPPVYFWLVALVDALSLRSLSSELLISLTSAVVLAASGLGMRLWLAEGLDRRRALFGALAYMLAPYHLYDLYGRGALAEACTYALLPPIAIGIRGIGHGRFGAVFLLAVSYALLIMAHLPSALLASVSLIPAYTLYSAWHAGPDRLRVLLAALGAGFLGLALSAIYLLPALGLAKFIWTEGLFGRFFTPSTWFFWRPSAWPEGAMTLMMPISAAALLLGIAGVTAGRRTPHKAEVAFWFWLLAGSLVMVSGAIPILWDIPFLSRVQFPWRMLVITEFAAVTLVTMGAPRFRSVLGHGAALLLVFTYTIAAARVNASMRETLRSGQIALAAIRSEYRDAPEYLPAGSRVPLREYDIPNGNLVPLPAMPIVGGEGAAKLDVSAAERRDGGIDLSVRSDRPVLLVARRFYFPHWQVRDGEGRLTETINHGPLHLLAWKAPAGSSHFNVRPGRAPFERTGAIISSVALLSLFGTALLFRSGHGAKGKDMFTIRL